MTLTHSPYVLYSDGQGNIFEDQTLYVTGRTGWDAVEVPLEEWIKLPDGGSLYELPGRRGIGIDVQTGEMRLCDKGWAVAALAINAAAAVTVRSVACKRRRCILILSSCFKKTRGFQLRKPLCPLPRRKRYRVHQLLVNSSAISRPSGSALMGSKPRS